MLIYKYTDFSDGSLEILSHGTIKFSRPNIVNDPFDCFPTHSADTSEILIKSTPGFLEKAANMVGKTTSDLLKEDPASRLQNALDSGLYNYDLLERFGICCLTRDPLNLLMWSHYAQNHTGFVVEFDVPEYHPKSWQLTLRQFASNLMPQKVTYQPNRPVLHPHDSKQEKFDKQIFTKGMVWEYEQEERVVDYKRGHGIHSYNQNVLSSVIAGAKIGSKFKTLEDTINKLNNAKGFDIPLHRVHLDPREYIISIPTRPELKQTYFQ